MRNADNHQLSWGVVGAAVEAVADYMYSEGGEVGVASFEIYEGRYQVGTGTIG